MKKLFKNLVVMAIGTVVLAANVYAAELSFDGINADPTQSHLHFIGDIDTNKAGRTATMFLLKPNTVLDNTDGVLNNNILFVDSASVEFEGAYEFEFDFKPDTGVINGGKCPVYIVCDDSIYKYEYEYKSWDEIKGLFARIRSTGISYSELVKYFDALGLENISFTDSKYTDVIVKRINALSSITDDKAGIDMLSDCFNNSKMEFELLKSIATLNNWTDVDAVILKISKLTGVDFSYGSANRERVLKDLLKIAAAGKIFYNVDELKTTFDTLVKNNSQSINPGTKPGGSGGGTGGSGGGGATGGGNVTKVTNINTDNSEIVVKAEIFDDIEEVEWAREAIENLSKSGIISGTGDKKFEPMREITREEFVKLAVITFGVYDAGLKADFEDTNPDEWYSSYIASAKKANIITGISETQFGLGQNITRQDMAVILYKGAISKGYKFGEAELDFSDSDEISDYALEAVKALVSRKIINGMGDGSFKPTENATRAQAAKMIYSLIGGDSV